MSFSRPTGRPQSKIVVFNLGDLIIDKQTKKTGFIVYVHEATGALTIKWLQHGKPNIEISDLCTLSGWLRKKIMMGEYQHHPKEP